jgi:GT2 family glycosyltransferase
LELANARYVLFLDPEMELIDGDLSAAVATLDRRPEVALAGARKVWEGGSPAPGMKHLPPHWTSGFLLARRTALDSGGWFDERFLAFAEADLCLRLKRVGWEALYLPSLTVRTHKGQLRESAWLEAHAAYARMQFARKHFPQVAADYRWALALRYAISVCFYSLLPRYGSSRRQAARAALATVLRGRVPLSQ